ncbi:hypothetical protein BDQ12DRAFT_67368 [Crucibulum laeve]|uniref:Uncharacterized protein n=1 Tax=Crucibulum laeve TaxID=68775 RepID=A0A5C3LGP2_9AGAR|nr:hypothetical protein BDQ12DRAFT_67368 [Crucibulum laeve]
MQTDYPDPPSPPQGHTHRQYYGLLLPDDVTPTWHKIYCQIHGIDLQIPHPLHPGRFLTLNSHPIARESLEKNIRYSLLYYEPVYTNDDLDEIGTCIAFVQYVQKDSSHTVPRCPTEGEVNYH